MDFPQNAYNRIEHNLTNHPPAGPAVVAQFEELRAELKQAAHAIDRLCPESREKSMALTSIEDACMYAIAGIARNQSELPLPAPAAADSAPAADR